MKRNRYCMACGKTTVHLTWSTVASRRAGCQCTNCGRTKVEVKAEQVRAVPRFSF